ncbi:catalase [Herbaspirillum sp. 1173]
MSLRRQSRMVLNQNPDNFFAEKQKTACYTAHLIPGIGFSQSTSGAVRES